MNQPNSELKSRREEVLNDILERLDSKKYDPTRGVYISWGGNSPKVDNILENTMEPVSLQDFLKTEWQEPCRVCAKGAMFLSYVFHNNKAELEHVYTEWDMTRAMADLFPKWETDLMECAFEGKYHLFDGYWKDHTDDVTAARDWALTFFNEGGLSHPRLRTIINYTLEHGFFAPINPEWRGEWPK